MLKGKTVLVAEDDSVMQVFVTGILKQELHCDNILSFKNGSQALAALSSEYQKKSIDLVLCDWELPGTTGDEILLQVRQDQDIRDLPFIMITSRSDEASLKKVAKLGITSYLIKPFSVNALMEKIIKAMSLEEEKKQKRFYMDTAFSVEIIFDDGAHTYEGALYQISWDECLIRTPLLEHGVRLYDKVGLSIQFNDETIRLKTEVQRMEPDCEYHSLKSFMMVGLKITEIDDANKNRLKILLK